MILEAFSECLRAEYSPDEPSVYVLYRWLTDILSEDPNDGDQISRVIHAEITMQNVDSYVVFEGLSKHGDRLLKSLYDYCQSYEDWQFRRWLHRVKASDFSAIY